MAFRHSWEILWLDRGPRRGFGWAQRCRLCSLVIRTREHKAKGQAPPMCRVRFSPMTAQERAVWDEWEARIAGQSASRVPAPPIPVDSSPEAAPPRGIANLSGLARVAAWARARSR